MDLIAQNITGTTKTNLGISQFKKMYICNTTTSDIYIDLTLTSFVEGISKEPAQEFYVIKNLKVPASVTVDVEGYQFSNLIYIDRAQDKTLKGAVLKANLGASSQKASLLIEI